MSGAKSALGAGALAEDPRSPGRLVLADGAVFEGVLFGAARVGTGEAVFTTGMTGYQEVLSDPSYAGQLVVMTAPQIGNTGINPEDMEADRLRVSGLIIHDLSPTQSSWRSEGSLEGCLIAQDIPGITGVDTRALTRHLRDYGAQMAAFGPQSAQELQEIAASLPPMEGAELASLAGTQVAYEWTEPLSPLDLAAGGAAPQRAPKVACIDFGAKHNMFRCLVDAGCQVHVLPPHTRAEEIREGGYAGLFLSNGPGDPAAVTTGIALVRALLGELPIFGICLGHQILALALGAKTYKLKFGHRGLNHPVKNLRTGKVEITTLNHGFVVDPATLPPEATLTHVHLNDDTCMGIEAESLRAFSVQFHPEAAAGPHDSRALFPRFAQQL